ncbi:MAG: hypothetical protein HS115_12075 [Spirochaetales bacterium]|nr:hypothetical protein [Spirochaetales bacterium]
MGYFEQFINSKILSVVVISFSALISTAAIVEVMARQELQRNFEIKKSELIEASLKSNQTLLADILSQEGNILNIASKIDEKNKIHSELIEEISKLPVRLRTLSLGWAIGDTETLSNLAKEYQVLLKAMRDPQEQALEPQSLYLTFTSTVTFQFIRKWSSTFLIAALAVLSGIAGSLVTVFRNDDYKLDFLKRFVLGIATGYIAFLLIKGGRSLFLLEGSEMVPLMNPYSTAFASLVGGMFTEKFFKLIADLFDSLIDRIVRKE